MVAAPGHDWPRAMRLLIVDDDPKFRGYLSRGLIDSGMGCAEAAGGVEALALLDDPRADPFDLILLDVMMPGQSGWELLSELRGRGSSIPVIFVTARDAVEERVRGLRLGADDYVIKPFSFDELLARIDAVLRRREARETLVVGELEIDLIGRRVELSEQPVDVSPKELDLLCALARARGRVLSRAELLEQVWGIAFEPGTNVVDVHVARLRRKLNARGSPLIETVIGEGYRLPHRPGSAE